MLYILNIKIIELAMVFSNNIEISSCYNTIFLLISPINQVKVSKLINNLLKLMLLYCKLLNELKI